MDTILVHPREIFRLAIVTAASAVIALHNPPIGKARPSEADIKVTRDLIRGGQLLKLELLTMSSSAYVQFAVMFVKADSLSSQAYRRWGTSRKSESISHGPDEARLGSCGRS